MTRSLVLDCTNRAMDTVAAIAALAVLFPLALLSRLGGARIRLVRSPRVGRLGGEVDALSFKIDGGAAAAFARAVGVAHLPRLWNVVRGELGLVGPRPLAPTELEEWLARGAAPHLIARRHAVRPGLVSLHWIRRRANVAYASELADDVEYAAAPGPLRRLGMLARAVLVTTNGEAPAATPSYLRILGVRVHNVTMATAIERIRGWLDDPAPRHVAFVNADCLNRCQADLTYRGVLNLANLTLADGSGVRLAGRILGQPIRENVNGTDLFPLLCAALEGSGHRLFLLGGRPGVAEGVRDWIARNHPALAVAGCRHGYFDASEDAEVAAAIRTSGATLLLVAFGAPRQDVWLHQNLAATGARVGVGVGGLFDFFSGRISRAPTWLRELGLEWVYRFWREPGRMWRRYWVGNFVFLARAATARLARRDGVFVLDNSHPEVKS